MPTQWSTFPMEFKGGLISNLTPLQQGVNAIGSATVLQNFEANKEGGYSKLKGFSKFSDTEVPGTGEILGLKVVSSGRAVVARKLDTAAVTEFQTATSTVNSSTTYTVTVQDVSGSNKYFIGGTQQPTLDLIEGFTYTFNYPSAHPFRFSTTSDGTHNSGTEYTTGVNHVSSTQTTITVAAGAPTLFYYCSQHSGMGGQVNTNTNTGAVSLDNNTATAIVNGATTSTKNVTLDRVRPFTAVTGTASGSGTSATFDVTNTSGTYAATVNAAGSDYAVNETVTIVGTNLGGATTANDATVTVTSVASSVLYSSAAYTYTGGGTGLVINVTRSGGSYSVAIANAGTGGYKVGETLTVLGTALGGATTANDATVTINSVNNVAVTHTNPTQSGYGGSGTSATFNVTRDGGTYTVAISAAGSGYAAGETITIVGTQLGGATTANDATITIGTVDGSGAITCLLYTSPSPRDS